MYYLSHNTIDCVSTGCNIPLNDDTVFACFNFVCGILLFLYLFYFIVFFINFTNFHITLVNCTFIINYVVELLLHFIVFFSLTSILYFCICDRIWVWFCFLFFGFCLQGFVFNSLFLHCNCNLYSFLLLYFYIRVYSIWVCIFLSWFFNLILVFFILFNLVGHLFLLLLLCFIFSWFSFFSFFHFLYFLFFLFKFRFPAKFFTSLKFND